jgi:hypothetical protein
MLTTEAVAQSRFSDIFCGEMQSEIVGLDGLKCKVTHKVCQHILPYSESDLPGYAEGCNQTPSLFHVWPVRPRLRYKGMYRQHLALARLSDGL